MKCLFHTHTPLCAEVYRLCPCSAYLLTDVQMTRRSLSATVHLAWQFGKLSSQLNSLWMALLNAARFIA